MEHTYLNFFKVQYELYFSYFENRHHMLIDSFPVPLILVKIWLCLF